MRLAKKNIAPLSNACIGEALWEVKVSWASHTSVVPSSLLAAPLVGDKSRASDRERGAISEHLA